MKRSSRVPPQSNENDVVKKRNECLNFINRTFPFYIPKDQHRIDPPDDCKIGEYWANAIQFLLSNKAHGFPMWKSFQEQVRSMDVSDACQPHISEGTVKRIMKHCKGVIACSEGNDVFFEESILLQLPFQPVLLFQWLTTAIEQVIQFESVLMEFYFLPFPAIFKDQISCLMKVMRKTFLNMGFLFDYLQHQVESENEIFVGNLELFDKVLKRVIVGLKVCLNNDIFQSLNDLKYKSFCRRKPSEKLCKLKKPKIPFKERNFVFNLDFWRALPHKDLKLFGSSDEKLERIYAKNHWRKINAGDTKKLFDVSFEPNALHSIDFSKLNKDIGFLDKISQFYQLRDALVSMNLKEEEEESGMISRVIVFIGDRELLIKLFELSAWIAMKFKLPLKNLVIASGSVLKDIGSIVSNIEQASVSAEEWLKILNSDNAKQIFPDLSAATEYTYRVKMKEIIWRCIKDHYEIRNFEKEKDKKLRDWQVAQYLLPCFINSYNDLCKLKPLESVKVWYEHFIDRLITEYEKEDGIKKSSWANIKKDIDANPILRDNTQLLEFFKDVSKKFSNKIVCNVSNLGYCPYFVPLYEVLTNNASQIAGLASEPCIYWNWLMWDFFSKIKSATCAANDHEKLQQPIIN